MMNKFRICLLCTVCTSIGCSPISTHQYEHISQSHESDLIVYTSTEGEQLLQQAESIGDFLRLTSYFETQQNTAYCGVASAVIALNTLGSSRPVSKQHGGVEFATQDNFFTSKTELVVDSAKVRKYGMTLEQLAKALQTHGVGAQAVYADEATLGSATELIRSALRDPKSVVLVNYHRPTIGQPGPGHISPIAAYEVQSRRFLILDVSRYKHAPIWIHEEVLWQGMLAIDSESERSRGFVIVQNNGR